MTVGLHTDKRMPPASEPRRCLNTCCFCIPLRVGCFILGYFNLVANAIRMLNFIGLALLVGVEMNGIHYDRSMAHKPKDVMDKEMAVICYVMLVVFVVNVVWLGVNIALLVGLHKRRPGPIRAYVWLGSMRLALCIGEFIFLIVTNGGDIQAQFSFGTILELILSAYFIYVYYTYAAQLEKDLKEKNESGNTSQLVDAPGFTYDIAFIYPTKIDKEFLIPPKSDVVYKSYKNQGL